MNQYIEAVKSDKATPRRVRRRAARKAGIYEAALDLLSRKGFDQVTVEEIAQAADVSKGTFFNYFPTKEHLLVEYRKRLLDGIHDYGESLTGNSARDLCRRYYRTLARRVEAEGERYRTLFKVLVARPHLFMLDPGTRRDYRVYFRRFLETGIGAGEIPADCDLDLLAETLRDLWLGSSLHWSLERPGESLEQIVLEKIDFLFDQLRRS